MTTPLYLRFLRWLASDQPDSPVAVMKAIFVVAVAFGAILLLLAMAKSVAAVASL